MRVRESKRFSSGDPLHQYRLYFLDGVGHITAAPYQFEADSDETAIRLADGWREGRKMELWCRDRRVHAWD